jgi:hypothetical protein
MKSFLWLGSEEVQGGKCLIAWCRVQIPMQCGGLVISNPLLVGMALRLRWPWLQSTDLSRPWIHLSVQEDQATKAFFSERRCATSSAMGPRSSSGLTHGLWCRPLRTSRLTWSLPKVTIGCFSPIQQRLDQRHHWPSQGAGSCSIT